MLKPCYNNCLWYETGRGNEKRCKRKNCPNYLLTDNPIDRCYAICRGDDAFDPISNLGDGPGFIQMAKNLTVAVAKHIADGGVRVTQEQYDERLAICKTCPAFSEGRCKDRSCGCFINVKAWMRSEGCPRAKWPKTQ